MLISRNALLWGMGFAFLLSIPFIAGGTAVWYGRADDVVITHQQIREVIVEDKTVIFSISYHARNAKNKPVTAQIETSIGQGEITGFLKSGGNKMLKLYKKQTSVVHLEPLEERDVFSRIEVPIEIYAQQLSADRDVVPQVRVIEKDDFDDFKEALSELSIVTGEAS